MFYIRYSDRLERTATWFNKLEGGIDDLKQVVIHDSLGICGELESQMQHLVNTYQCEWTTIEDVEKMKRFRHFVNSEESDPNIVTVEERGQQRPAYEHEKPAMPTLPNTKGNAHLTNAGISK